jgi:hypothetical protein
MIYPSPNFFYNNSHQPILYNGLWMHSILELKYALMIEETHADLREGVQIYYDQAKCASTNIINANTKLYKPDFLIRSYKTGQAILVEVKPNAYDYHGLMRHRTLLANHFIKTHHYDWEFRIVFEKEIKLHDRAQEKLARILLLEKEMKNESDEEIKPISYYLKQNFRDAPLKKAVAMEDSEYRFFVKRGRSAISQVA